MQDTTRVITTGIQYHLNENVIGQPALDCVSALSNILTPGRDQPDSIYIIVLTWLGTIESYDCVTGTL